MLCSVLIIWSPIHILVPFLVISTQVLFIVAAEKVHNALVSVLLSLNKSGK